MRPTGIAATCEAAATEANYPLLQRAHYADEHKQPDRWRYGREYRIPQLYSERFSKFIPLFNAFPRQAKTVYSPDFRLACGYPEPRQSVHSSISVRD